MAQINPWGSDLIDYANLFDNFGMQHLPEQLVERFSDSMGFRRGLVFAHRDFDKFVAAADKGKKVAVMTGIKPSNRYHLGSKQTAEEVIYLQKKLNAKVFFCIADLEANADNHLSLEESDKIAVDNIADLLALGLDEKNAYIYKQSNNVHVLRLAHMFSSRTTLATLESLYGHQNLGLYSSVLAQAGDILAPMLDEFGMDNVVVPVGADQDPHVRLTRDLAAKFEKELGFTVPAAIFHKFFRSLDGATKMSKRDEGKVIFLDDIRSEAKKKVSRALTGGRATEEEQRRQGAEYYKCVVGELDRFHFEESDAQVEERKQKCLTGKILCGQCKGEVAEKVASRLEEHAKKKKKLLSKAEKIVANA